MLDRCWSDTESQLKTRVPRTLLLLLGLALALSACGRSEGAAPAPLPTAPATSVAEESGTHAVEYRVYGAGGFAEVIYVGYTETAGESREARVTLPWRMRFEARDEELLYVAGLGASGRGAVSCEILVDGKQWKAARTGASDPVASCQGVLGKN